MIRPVGAPTATAPAREVQARATPTTPAAIRTALARAVRSELGRSPSEGELDVLTAHVSHETGRGERMFNFNFGGIKGASDKGTTARYGTREVTAEGKDQRIVDGFRAYGSLAEGASDYVKFLKSRYGTALDAAEKGDVDGFAHALKRRGYFTDGIEPYAASLRGLVRDAQRADGIANANASYTDARPAMTSQVNPLDDAASFPTTMELARVLDSVASMAARIGAPIDEPKKT